MHPNDRRRSVSLSPQSMPPMDSSTSESEHSDGVLGPDGLANGRAIWCQEIRGRDLVILERAIGREESKEIVADIATTVRERPTSAAALMS